MILVKNVCRNFNKRNTTFCDFEYLEYFPRIYSRNFLYDEYNFHLQYFHQCNLSTTSYKILFLINCIIDLCDFVTKINKLCKNSSEKNMSDSKAFLTQYFQFYTLFKSIKSWLQEILLFNQKYYLKNNPIHVLYMIQRNQTLKIAPKYI